MIKAHKRKNSGSMRRASRVYLTHANAGKVAALKRSLLFYVNVVNYFIERFWSMEDFTPALADKVITRRAVNRFKITARLAQCAAKQAKEIVRSQKDRKVKTMPLLRRKVATLDDSSRDEEARRVDRIDLREKAPRIADRGQGYRDRSRLQEGFCHIRWPGDRRRIERSNQAQGQAF